MFQQWWFQQWWQSIGNWFAPKIEPQALEEKLGELRQQAPIPVLWLFGKTQSGKSSVVRFLTRAEKAEIGSGFRPCTRHSSLYDFPDAQAPLMQFLDTRGLDEPGYEASEDLAAFDKRAHVLLVTVKLLDHAQENVLAALRKIRMARPQRPVVLLLTCLHEAYPQQQHPDAYLFDAQGQPTAPVPEVLRQNLDTQRARFGPLVDRIVPIDLTQPIEGFHQPEYGGEQLKATLLELLPTAQAQVLQAVDQSLASIQDLYARKAMPTILAYSTMAATAGAVPVPLVDTALLAGVQSAMLHQLAKLYGQPLTRERLAELAAALGIGFVGRQVARSLIKFIPVVGSAVGAVSGAVLAGASTYALGKAFCRYYRAVLDGKAPDPQELKRYYQEQFASAQASWERLGRSEKAT
ncbi:MAG: DUF697 domain-containing protein [Gemmataceae bacterium]